MEPQTDEGLLQRQHRQQCGRCGSYHGGPCGAFKRGVALVSYLIEHSNGLTRWTFVDMTVRLRRLAKVHATEGAEDTIDGLCWGLCCFISNAQLLHMSSRKF